MKTGREKEVARRRKRTDAPNRPFEAPSLAQNYQLRNPVSYGELQQKDLKMGQWQKNPPKESTKRTSALGRARGDDLQRASEILFSAVGEDGDLSFDLVLSVCVPR